MVGNSSFFFLKYFSEENAGGNNFMQLKVVRNVFPSFCFTKSCCKKQIKQMKAFSLERRYKVEERILLAKEMFYGILRFKLP